MERQRRHQGNVRRAECRLRRKREAQLHQVERHLAGANPWRPYIRDRILADYHRSSESPVLPRSSGVSEIVNFARWPVLLVVASLMIAVIYRFGPSRDQPQWRWISPADLRHGDMDRRFVTFFLVHYSLRKLQQDLRIARSCSRLHDLDLDIDDGHPHRRQDQCRARTSNRGRHHGGVAGATRQARGTEWQIRGQSLDTRHPRRPRSTGSRTRSGFDGELAIESQQGLLLRPRTHSQEMTDFDRRASRPPELALG